MNIDDEIIVHDRGNALDEQSSDERACVAAHIVTRSVRRSVFFEYLDCEDIDRHLKPRCFNPPLFRKRSPVQTTSVSTAIAGCTLPRSSKCHG
jgi:hypothetical protein